MKTPSPIEEFRHLDALRQNRTLRNQSHELFVEGVRPINQALSHGWAVRALAYTRERRLSDWAEGIVARADRAKHVELTAMQMQKLSQKEETSELIAVVAMPEDDLARIAVREKLLVVVFDRPASPGNLGTLIRSCDALGADGLIVTGHAVDVYDPETIRATTGSFFSVPVVRLPSHKELVEWVEALRPRLAGLQMVGTSAHAPARLQDIDLRAPTVLVVGNETHGLSAGYRALCDVMATIPMVGSATSLNVACAASILLYEVARQRG